MYTFSLKHIFNKIMQFYNKIFQSESPHFGLQVSIPKMTQFSLDRNCGSHHMTNLVMSCLLRCQSANANDQN